MERRKHKRFSATAFINRPVTLTPFPPYIGKPIKGKLIDLSAGGISMLIGQIIPQGTDANLSITFPDHSVLKSKTTIRHMIPKDRQYLHGLEFLNLEPAWIERLTKMSNHYIDCEQRIQQHSLNACVGAECAFFTMCKKPERTDLLVNIDDGLLLEFKHLQTLP